jgi:hypothetical protein
MLFFNEMYCALLLGYENMRYSIWWYNVRSEYYSGRHSRAGVPSWATSSSKSRSLLSAGSDKHSSRRIRLKGILRKPHILDSRVCLFNRLLLYFYHWVCTVEVTAKIEENLLECTQKCQGQSYEEKSEAEIKIIVRLKYEIGSLWLLLKLGHRVT